jgi:beta-lactam-binding protein with PASTA domain
VRTRIVALLLAALAVGGCGATAKPKPRPARRAAVPDVRGLEAPDAAVRLLRARYCVRLEVAKVFPTQARAEVPVVRQSPAPGARRRAWSTVTLTIGLPPDTPKEFYGIDFAGAGSAPCPPIQTSN